ncbi:MAG: hypothetical protein RBR35_05590 [Salinivirgaceae bacterium]|nr:hypothetical protein [Salinivirgaceae bacterium]
MRILLIIYCLSVMLSDEILRFAQDDNTIRGKLGGKRRRRSSLLFPPSSKQLTVILSGGKERRISQER